MRMFEWDIFLSYGWSGNAADEGDRAWISGLREQLRVALRTPLGHDPKIFLDVDATRAGALTPILEDALDRSRLFLFAVSPGSCQSSWCQWEINRFLDRGHSAATRNEVLLPEDRLLGVLLEPVPTEDIPAPLQPLVFRPFNLTRPVVGRDSTRTVAWRELEEVKPARTEFDRLVADLATRLRTIQKHEWECVPSTGITVFLGTSPTPTHEREYLTPLRRDLLLRGHDVLRASVPAGETENDYRIRLGAVLGRVGLSVHLLGEPVTLAGWKQPVSAWQLRSASDHRNTISLFTWVDPDSTAHPGELAEILQKGDHHFDRRQPFSDLRTALLERAGECAYRKQAATTVGGRSVVIAYCEEDRAHASAIKQRLQQQHGLRVQLALPPRETAGQRNRVNRGLFEEVDAVMVYYSQHDEWMVLTCQTVRKVFRKSGRPRSAALVLHPPPPPKDDCDQLDFANLRRSNPNDFAAIDQWASSLKGQGA
jgi:hypothetical protein